ncbi:TraB/GumN family protein [Amphritea pacifica]|uniref:TraB/GumN family protein n=1 Tax=Amphritea pacifica TaxID=2811233 RepID=UPI00196648A5|nr:TraB/GumN family protein [Amphritea pacifica]MBN1008680.1 TraB/GumN family protein [Amphritea pacifica]
MVGFTARLFRAVVLCVVSVVTVTATAATSVWKVSSGDNVVYVGGTLHVLRQSDYPLPPEFDRAYQHADKLVFETDLEQLHSAEVLQRMQQAVRYPEGISGLDKRVSAPLYQRIVRVWTQYGLPAEALERLRPSGIVITLTMLNLKQVGVDAQGIDDFYHSRATADGKPVAGLESVEQQIRLLSGMGAGDEEKFMRISLDELDQSGGIINEMVAAWRGGRLADLEHLVIDDMRRESPASFRTLMVDRNQQWLPQIDAMLRDRPVEFVLVGSGHLAGKEGLINQLQQRGYRVEPVAE